MTLTKYQKLAATAFLVSLLAMVVSLALPDGSSSTERTANVEYLSVLELAREIKNRNALTLVDLRSEQEFQQMRIASSIHIPFGELLQHDFAGDERLVLYSADDSLSRQAFFMFRGMGFRQVAVVIGGIHDWHDRILYPKIPVAIPEEDRELAERIKELSTFFGGRIDFVEEGSPLDYYRGGSPQSGARRESELVRMGCAF